MIIVMQKEAQKNEITAVLKSLGKLESYISKIDGNSVIVVK